MPRLSEADIFHMANTLRGMGLVDEPTVNDAEELWCLMRRVDSGWCAARAGQEFCSPERWGDA
jgi:hypothetical protein